jgi:2-polyprenyl-6-methoxyphenol hydroxylase-like FAD-dependent oxidoreductase
MDLPQTLLEPILIRKAVESGFIVRFDTEFVSFSENDHHDIVQVKVRDLVFNKNLTIHCKYLFGCDGSHSRVLEQLNIPIVVGKGAGIKAWDLLVRVDLSHLVKFRDGSLRWTFQDDHICPGKLLIVHPRMYKPWTEWVVGFSWAPGSEPDSNVVPTHEDWLKRLRKMIGDENVEPEILDIVRWEMNNAIAERSSQGRVFCLGDAVHRHGPGGALGSNTAIQDAYNLAWKVAYVLKGMFFISNLLNHRVT